MQVVIYILSIYLTVVNYDDENGWTNFISRNQTKPQITDEVKSALEKLKFANMDAISSMDDLGTFTGYANKDFYEFAKTADLSGDLVGQYQAHLEKTTKSTSKFSPFTSKAGSLLKSFGAGLANMGMGMLAGFALEGVITLIDNIVNYQEK